MKKSEALEHLIGEVQLFAYVMGESGHSDASLPFWLSVRIGQLLDAFNDYEVADG